jgi:hypothetical protein
MTDWIKHDGGPQPVADDVWVSLHEPDGYVIAWLSQEVSWQKQTSYRVVNQHLIDGARKEGLQMGLKAFDEARLAVEGDIQKLCDAARLEGIRLGLEAAAKVINVEIEDWANDGFNDRIVTSIDALEMGADALRALDPETIAREAVLDQLTSEAQEENMGYDKETER